MTALSCKIMYDRVFQIEITRIFDHFIVVKILILSHNAIINTLCAHILYINKIMQLSLRIADQ